MTGKLLVLLAHLSGIYFGKRQGKQYTDPVEAAERSTWQQR